MQVHDRGRVGQLQQLADQHLQRAPARAGLRFWVQALITWHAVVLLNLADKRGLHQRRDMGAWGVTAGMGLHAVCWSLVGLSDHSSDLKW